MSNFAKGQIIIGKDYKYPAGALNVDEVKEDGSVVAYPQGGGFQMTFSPESLVKNKFRIVPQEEISGTPWLPKQFVMDCWEDEVFQGYSTGESWNGWEKPVFELAEARRIVDLINKENPLRGTYDEKADIFTIEDQGDDPADIVKGCEITVDGKKIVTYAIGTGSWTWQEAPKPKPEDEDAEEEE